MTKTIFFVSVFVAMTFSVAAQQLIPSPNIMPLGAYYYPEHGDEDQGDRDLKRIAELGFVFTHFGEFAWSRMEPEEGVFDFEWLTTYYPDALIVNAAGRRLRHGTDLHAAQAHPVYMHFSERIIYKLGEQYGNRCGVVTVWK
jgi:beta-galactosidase